MPRPKQFQEPYHVRNREKILSERRERYRNDPEYRESMKKKTNNLYHSSPKYREKLKLRNYSIRKGNPEKWKEYQDTWMKNNPVYVMYHNAKRHAKKKGVPFGMNWKLLEIPEVCPVFGIKLIPGGGAGADETPSLDRIVPDKGYVDGNVRIISMRANRIKDNGTAEEHRKIADYIDGLL